MASVDSTRRGGAPNHSLYDLGLGRACGKPGGFRRQLRAGPLALRSIARARAPRLARARRHCPILLAAANHKCFLLPQWLCNLTPARCSLASSPTAGRPAIILPSTRDPGGERLAVPLPPFDRQASRLNALLTRSAVSSCRSYGGSICYSILYYQARQMGVRSLQTFGPCEFVVARHLAGRRNLSCRTSHAKG